MDATASLLLVCVGVALSVTLLILSIRNTVAIADLVREIRGVKDELGLRDDAE